MLTFKASATLWRQDRWKPIVAGVVNLAVNMAFVIYLPADYKLDGVILSTILAYVFIQVPWESHVVFTDYFDKAQGRCYWSQQLRFAALALILCAIAWYTAHIIPLHGLPGLVAKGIAAALLASILMLLCFHRDILAILRRRQGPAE